MENRIDLQLTFPVDTKVLTALSELDPEDDAIHVETSTSAVRNLHVEWKATP